MNGSMVVTLNTLEIVILENRITRWIEKTGYFLDDYIQDPCNKTQQIKKKDFAIICLIIAYIIVVSAWSAFANIAAIPICLLDKDCRGF